MRLLAGWLVGAVLSCSAGAQETVVRVWWHGHHGHDEHHEHDGRGGHGGGHHDGERGHDDLGALARAWEDGFTKTHPGVRFENQAVGDESALGGLYTGVADVALIDRPPLPIEVDAYQQGAGHDPTGVAVATGSVRAVHHAPALAVVVAPGNPLKDISLAQLDAVFGADHRRGMERVHTWGELGLTGAWAQRPVRLYGFRIGHEESTLFEHDVMKDSHKWREGLHEFDAPEAVSAAVAKDADGIGITSMDGVSAVVRVLAVKDDAGDDVKPTTESLREGKYALERQLFAYYNRDAAKTVREFLAYTLSAEGQALVPATGFVPLSDAVDAKSREMVQK